jgi:hypothetical protein
VEEGSICLECHDKGDEGYKAAVEMKAAIVHLDRRLLEVAELVRRAGSAGIEMSDEELRLREAKSQLVFTRNLVHTFDPDTIRAATEEGDTILREVNSAGMGAFEEIAVRRWGLALSSLIIVLLIAGLYLMLKRVERGA